MLRIDHPPAKREGRGAYTRSFATSRKRGSIFVPVTVAATAPDADAILAEITALCMEAARDLTRRLKASEDDDHAVALSQSLARIARSVRQTIHLQTRLREGPLSRRQAAAEAHASMTHQRLQKVREVIARKLVDKPSLETPDFWDRLDAELQSEAAEPERPVIESVIRIARTLGLRRAINIYDARDLEAWKPRVPVRPP